MSSNIVRKPPSREATSGSEEAAAPPRITAKQLLIDNRIAAVVAGIAGVAGLATVLLGPIAVFAARDVTDHTVVAATLKSDDLRLVASIALGLGLIALAVGPLVYRRMDTKVARETAITGGLAGLQAGIIALALLLFTRGEMEILSLHFLNLSNVLPALDQFVRAAGNTLKLAAFSAVFGIGLGLLIALLLISKRRITRAPARLYVNVIRGTPLLVQISIVYFGVALGLGIPWEPPTALIVAFALNTGAYAAEIFRAGLQSIEKAQLQAARGLGLSYLTAMRYVVVPQAVRRVIPPIMNEYISLTKKTSFLVFLGVSTSNREIYSVASQGYAEFFNTTFFLASAVGYLIITLPLIGIVNYVERRLRSGLMSIA